MRFPRNAIVHTSPAPLDLEGGRAPDQPVDQAIRQLGLEFQLQLESPGGLREAILAFIFVIDPNSRAILLNLARARLLWVIGKSSDRYGNSFSGFRWNIALCWGSMRL